MFQISDPNDINSVADWVELSVVFTKDTFSKSAILSKVAAFSGDDFQEENMVDLWDELERRMYLYGETPPFIVEPREIIPNILWESKPEYVMCLWLSLYGNSRNPTPTGKLFERVSLQALKNYLQGEGLVFGFPSRCTIREVCENIHEKFKSELPPEYKDGGVDVIAWKPFGDRRGNQILVLMQCAGGYNWTSKTTDVNERLWREECITFGSKPVRGFSTVVVVEKNDFLNVALSAGLVFDRPRIYQNTNLDSDKGLKNDILSWCQEQVSEHIVS